MRLGRWLLVTVVVVVVIAIVATRLGDRMRGSARAAAPTGGATAQTAEPAETDSRGRTLYRSACVMCHGERGKGTELGPALEDSARAAEAIVRVVQEGAQPTEERYPPMPPRGDGTWSDADAREVAEYVRSLRR